MKTSEVSGAYNALMNAKLNKMDGNGKIKVVKIIKAMKPIATAFEDFRKDALEKLRPEGFDEMQKKLEQWQKDGDKTTLTSTERAEINQFFADYSRDVDKCLKEEMEKDNDITFDKLESKEFIALCDGNDWSAGVMLELMDLISE